MPKCLTRYVFTLCARLWGKLQVICRPAPAVGMPLNAPQCPFCLGIVLHEPGYRGNLVMVPGQNIGLVCLVLDINVHTNLLRLFRFGNRSEDRRNQLFIYQMLCHDSSMINES